jgi:4-hydroxy-tetrahydrodipicolinate reductase
MQQPKGLALVGNGKMGRLIATLAPANGFAVVQTLSGENNREGQGVTPEAFASVDVAIEFSNPEAAPDNLKRLAALRIPVVTGTTGWLNELPAVSEAVSNAGSALVWSPNFSIGVAVFRRLVGMASELLSNEPEYGAWAWEIHHDSKKDAPSGTMLHLVETMRQHGYGRTVDVASNRAGKHLGTHEIGFDSLADTITLRHTARSRDGFALGALKAAHWAIGRRGVFTFEEVLFGSDRPED